MARPAPGDFDADRQEDTLINKRDRVLTLLKTGIISLANDGYGPQT